MTTRLPRAIFIVACASLAGGAGCHQAPTTAQRNASYERHAAARVHDDRIGATISIHDYVLLRTAGLGRSEGGKSSFGLAAALDRRGYYLTAAHCVPEDKVSVYVVHPSSQSEKNGGAAFVHQTMEVVWRGDLSRGEPDLAILYHPRPPEAVFAWASEMKPGEVVFAGGTNYDRREITSLGLGCIAGQLLGTAEHTSSARPWTQVVSTVPMHPGDSGGPLVTAEGRLLGINAFYHPRKLGADLASAVRPDLAWLRGALDADYARRAGTPATVFWTRPDPAGHLADLLIDRLRDLETVPADATQQEYRQVAFQRQEIVVHTLASEAGVNEWTALDLLDFLPRLAPGIPTPAIDRDALAEWLRRKLQLK